MVNFWRLRIRLIQSLLSSSRDLAYQLRVKPAKFTCVLYGPVLETKHRTFESISPGSQNHQSLLCLPGSC